MTLLRPDTIVVVDAQTFAVLRVAYNHCLLNDPTAREISRVGIIRVLVESVPVPSVYVVVGPPGDMLYCGLAAHLYAVQHPRCAHPMLARLARATVERDRGRSQGWMVAWQVITAWGPVVQPWLGVTKLDERGVPMAVCAEYGERLPL
jgi:hypothetical protein